MWLFTFLNNTSFWFSSVKPLLTKFLPPEIGWMLPVNWRGNSQTRVSCPGRIQYQALIVKAAGGVASTVTWHLGDRISLLVTSEKLWGLMSGRMMWQDQSHLDRGGQISVYRFATLQYRYRNQYPILGLLSDDYKATSPVNKSQTIVIERTGEIWKQVSSTSRLTIQSLKFLSIQFSFKESISQDWQLRESHSVNWTWLQKAKWLIKVTELHSLVQEGSNCGVEYR